MVFPGELGKQTELAADVPVGFGVKLILAVLAANDPGLGFGTGEQAELVVLMEQADVGAGGSIVASAQVVVGISLGLRFVGITRRMMISGLGLSLLSGASMLGIGAILSLIVARLTDFSLETLIISFAPGGVTEMSLIALSLAANPTFVTLHHLVRIVATVVELAVVRKMNWFAP